MSVHSVFWVYSSCGHQRGEIFPLFPVEPPSVALIQECRRHLSVLCCALEMRHTEKGRFN